MLSGVRKDGVVTLDDGCRRRLMAIVHMVEVWFGGRHFSPSF